AVETMIYPIILLLKCENATVGDIVFLIDGSTSIEDKSFQEVRTFLSNVIRGLDIGPNKVRVGLAQFSDDTYQEFLLNEHMNKQSLLNAVRQVPHRKGGTLTGQALEFLLEEYFTKQAGSRADERVPQIAVVITDGDSSDDVSEPARKLRNHGVLLFSIGVGQINQEELNKIASVPRFRLNIDSFDALQKLTNTLLQTVCDSIENQQKGESSLTESMFSFGFQFYKKNHSPNRWLTIDTPFIECKRANVADIVFIVDESGSIKEANFQLMRTFLSSIISGLEVGLARVRLGIVTYNEMQTAQLYLNTFQTKTDILQLINFMPYSGGGTNTGAALDFTLKNIFNEKRGSRKGVQKVAVVVTDGKSQDSVVVPAATLRRAGVTVYAVGIKDANEAELREMATSPPEKHVFIVDSFTQLKSLEQTLQKSLCRNIIEDAITSVDMQTEKICFRQERDTIFKMAAKTLKLTKLDAKCTNTHKHGESIQRHKLSQN
uniref:VWFA domain-containing protein n=1 Tax=Acanthochromis polyacanthus TaxID=80966 RepID=A0A3Q1FGL9_9TELE